MIASKLARDQLQFNASQLGFSLFGIANAQPSPGFDRLIEWLRRGYAGTMSYIQKRSSAYENPDSVLTGCKCVIMLAMPYAPHPSTMPSKAVRHDDSDFGIAKGVTLAAESKMGNYASGQVDYHDLLHDRLDQLRSILESMYPGSKNRGVVDTAPLMERDFAQMAGLGWIGKNTLLLNREHGSYFFLAALLTDVELAADDPFATDHCGTCTACLDACPTSAFVAPRVLNASRCISYLTIEYRGEIAPELSDQMADWIFGCDECQIVCPWNRKRQAEIAPEFKPIDMETKTSLEHWLSIDEQTFRELYRRTPFWRTKLSGMQRNAMIAAGNTNRQDLRAHVERFSTSEDQVLVNTSIWCLKKLDGNDKRSSPRPEFS
jgi:epoxyqueuosine reductase